MDVPKVGLSTWQTHMLIICAPLAGADSDSGKWSRDNYKNQKPCGGADGGHYVVQSFKVNLQVAKSNYIAIKVRSTGTLSCSGGSGFLLYAPPLPVGGRSA